MANNAASLSAKQARTVRVFRHILRVSLITLCISALLFVVLVNFFLADQTATAMALTFVLPIYVIIVMSFLVPLSIFAAVVSSIVLLVMKIRQNRH